MKPLLFVCALLSATPIAAQSQKDVSALVAQSVTRHVVPRFETLAATTAHLKEVAQTDCHADSAVLRAAFHDGFDAWMAVSHLRFGPSEIDERAFALAFWPDTKGFTPKTLSRLITEQDPVVKNAQEFAQVSIAGRGFFGLEQLLYDPRISQLGDAAYRCALVQAVSIDMDAQADAILEEWTTEHATAMTAPDVAGPYRTDLEALQTLFKALDSGLQFNAEARLGRPLGTFDKPRPRRAEAHRSNRSLRHIDVSLRSLQELADSLTAQSPSLRKAFDDAFALTLQQVQVLSDDPVFAGVADIQGRFEIEILQQYIGRLREITTTELGPDLGVTGGFNALDGD